MTCVNIDQVIQQKDVDAGIYLLQRILRISGCRLNQKRAKLQALKNRLEEQRILSESDKREIITSYHEVVG